MSKRVQWIQHRGQRVLQVDLRAATREDQLECADEYSKALKGEPENSARVMALLTDLDFHPDVVAKVKSPMLQMQGKVRRSALVGAGGILKVAFDGFFAMARFIGMPVNEERGRYFDNEDAAKDWLAS